MDTPQQFNMLPSLDMTAFDGLLNPAKSENDLRSGSPEPPAKRNKSDGQPKKFPCPSCNKSYSRKTHLQRHMAVHGAPTFTCDICDRGFYRRDHYKYHQRTHTNERPYPCTVDGCTAAFRQQSALSRHMGKHRRQRALLEGKVVFANSISPAGSQCDFDTKTEQPSSKRTAQDVRQPVVKATISNSSPLTSANSSGNLSGLPSSALPQLTPADLFALQATMPPAPQAQMYEQLLQQQHQQQQQLQQQQQQQQLQQQLQDQQLQQQVQQHQQQLYQQQFFQQQDQSRLLSPMQSGMSAASTSTDLDQLLAASGALSQMSTAPATMAAGAGSDVQTEQAPINQLSGLVSLLLHCKTILDRGSAPLS